MADFNLAFRAINILRIRSTNSGATIMTDLSISSVRSIQMMSCGASRVWATNGGKRLATSYAEFEPWRLMLAFIDTDLIGL